YHYSSYDQETEVEPRERPAVLILGSGPNRIGQGIEFDYSCVHAALALGAPELPGGGYETVMINCNPETVSTDYDIADRLYFEPLTFEDVVEVYEAEKAAGPVAGVIVQVGCWPRRPWPRLRLGLAVGRAMRSRSPRRSAIRCCWARAPCWAGAGWRSSSTSRA